MPHCTFTVALVMIVMGFAALVPADAAPVQVSQESSPGAGDFDANVLGYIDPYVTGMTASVFYQYGVPNGASYNGELNGGPNPVSSVTQIFLVEALDGLSLFVVHDNPNDGSGGSTAMRWDLAGDTAGYLQGDDPTEGLGGGGTTFSTTHNWAPCCTDGYVIGSLEGGWEMFGVFRAVPVGILEWAAVDSDGTMIPLVLESERRVRLAAEIKVSVDIKPGSCPNPLNRKSKGVLPVAILGTADFDVCAIDPETVTLSRPCVAARVEPLRWAYEDVATPFEGELCDCHEMGADGEMDLTLKFDTERLVTELELCDVPDGVTIQLTLTGNLKEEAGGTAIRGADCVWIKGAPTDL